MVTLRTKIFMIVFVIKKRVRRTDNLLLFYSVNNIILLSDKVIFRKK